jgi:hypothetical protein
MPKVASQWLCFYGKIMLDQHKNDIEQPYLWLIMQEPASLYNTK